MHERVYCDAQNLAYEYSWYNFRERKFSFESLPLIINTGEIHYGIETFLILPKHIFGKKWKNKCENEETVNEILQLRDSGKIIEVGNGNDECCSGILHLFDPSNTTFVKHFTSRISTYENNNGIRDNYVAGYGNTTSAVDAVQFKFGSGNIDAGTIKMYGIK